MSFPEIYMLGDSHGVELYSAIRNELEIKHFSTIGGYGILGYFDKNSLRRPSDSYIQALENFLISVDKSSIIIISACDPDIRIGCGSRFKNETEAFGNFVESFDKAFCYIEEKANPYYVLFLDFYPMLGNACEMNISLEKRIKYRELYLNAFQEASKGKKFGIVSSHKDAIIENISRDTVHYDLGKIMINSKSIYQCLLDKILEHEIKKK